MDEIGRNNSAEKLFWAMKEAGEAPADGLGACINGDALRLPFPDNTFDRVICSRTVQELAEPKAVILEALRVGRALTVGFVNHGFWKNRLNALLQGSKIRNEVYTTEWFESRPSNPVTVLDFERFCGAKGIRIARRAHLAGDWRTPCAALPNLLAGYALYDLAR